MPEGDTRPSWTDHNNLGWRKKWREWLAQYKGKRVALRRGAELHTTSHQVDIQVAGRAVRVTLYRDGVFLPSDEDEK